MVSRLSEPTASMPETLAARIRDKFPILSTNMDGKPLVYLDNGATTQKPTEVIDAICDYYRRDNANIHRGLYELSVRATEGFEAARATVSKFLNAAHTEECIFVRGTTEGINLVASSWGTNNLLPGNEVIVTGLEHHSNIVPWQMAASSTGAQLKVWHADDQGSLDLDGLRSLLTDKTRLIAIQHVSNALGTIHDVESIVQLAKNVGALVLVDGAQWVGHHTTDVQQLGCDFYVFSGHKLFGPTGIGVLWGRRDLLAELPPYQGGGDMIEKVAFAETTYAPLPNRFEAGTPDIAGAIGLAAAIDFVTAIGFDEISLYEQQLLSRATELLSNVPGLRILGPDEPKAAVISFVLEQPSIAPLDIATHLSADGIAVRTGHHCCMPLMGHLQVSGTTRISLAMYNTIEEIESVCASLKQLVTKRDKPRDLEVAGTIRFPPAKSNSIAESAAAVEEEFLDFDDAESKTELLLDFGRSVPDYFEPLKAISAPVPGCMSEVYLIGREIPNKPGRFEFAADSNAEIVRGLIGVLQHLFSGQPADDVIAFDIESLFRRIGLDQFVSTQRRNGLDGMIRRIRSLAESIAS